MLSKVERLKNALANSRADLKEASRIGTTSLITSVGGGLVGGYLNARYPTVASTTVPTSGALGAGLVLLGMSGAVEEHSDAVAALGSGLLAAAIADEAEKYFAAA